MTILLYSFWAVLLIFPFIKAETLRRDNRNGFLFLVRVAMYHNHIMWPKFQYPFHFPKQLYYSLVTKWKNSPIFVHILFSQVRETQYDDEHEANWAWQFLKLSTVWNLISRDSLDP